MKTVIEIEWNEPQEQAWLCADNIAVALHAHCPNTRFKVCEVAALRAAEQPSREAVLEEALKDIADGPQPIEDYKHGIQCGLEDRDLQNASPYSAAEYGYEQGLDWCADIAIRALKAQPAETAAIDPHKILERAYPAKTAAATNAAGQSTELPRNLGVESPSVSRTVPAAPAEAVALLTDEQYADWFVMSKFASKEALYEAMLREIQSLARQAKLATRPQMSDF